jgi:hypothetical protein
LAPGRLRVYVSRETGTVRVLGLQALRMWVFSGRKVKWLRTVALSAGPAAWTWYAERKLDILACPQTHKLLWFQNGVPQSPMETGQQPVDLMIEPRTDKLWVANAGDRYLNMVHLENPLFHAQVEVTPGPLRFQISPDENTLYVLCAGHDPVSPASTVQLIDLPNQKAGIRYALGQQVTDFKLASSGKFLYSVSPQGFLVYNLITDQKTLIPTGQDPQGLALSPDGAVVYIACRRSHAVYVHFLEKTLH